jgi:hypothetical protein
VTVPGTKKPVVTAQALVAECTQDPCEATATIAAAKVDLNPLGIPLVVTATLIEAMASCSDGDTTLASSIAKLTVKVRGETVRVNVGTGANFVVIDETVAGVSVRIVLNEQVGDTVNAIRITASAPVLTATQTADVIIASATASCSS